MLQHHIILGILLTLCAASQSWAAQIEFDRVEENTIYFKAAAGTDTPKPLKTELFDLAYLGPVFSPETTAGTPTAYFLFGAKPCKSCQHDRTVYAIHPTKGKVQAFTYPGRILDPKTRAVLHESRGFFGRCLREKKEGYVAFQKERVDRRSNLQPSVFVAEANEAEFDEKLIERRMPALRETLARVKAKQCREVEGRNRFMLSKPLDLTPRKTGDEEEEDDEPEPVL